MGRKRVKRKLSLPKGIDSKLELELSKAKLARCEWKPPSLKYQMIKTYNPDAKIGNTLIEVKGYFRNSAEAAKYLCIKEQYPNIDLVFIFANPSKPIPWAKRRKDGSRMTHAEWAEQKGFKYYGMDDIPPEWGR